MLIHHLGIVAQSLDEALNCLPLEKYGLVEEVYDKKQNNILYFLKSEDSSVLVEIVVPVDDKSSVKQFSLKQKIGLHHLAFKSESITNSLEYHQKKKGNFQLKQYEINVNVFGGKIKTGFVFANGILIEYVENVSH